MSKRIFNVFIKIQFIAIFLLCFCTYAQPDKKNHGKRPSLKPEDRLERQDKAFRGADYEGTVKANDKEKPRNSQYSGNISTTAVAKRKKNIVSSQRKFASYRGNIKYVDYAKIRRKKNQDVASYRGNIKVKKRPQGASKAAKFKGTSSKQRKLYKNYDPRKLQKGRSVKKSDIPNYQREKPQKLKYDSRENIIWAPAREVPKPMQKAEDFKGNEKE